jgi:two-component system NtrC family sensor kinase
MAFARQHEPLPETVDVHGLLEQVLAMKEVDLSVSNVEVRKEFCSGRPEVFVTRNQLEQVFINLLNNARDAMDGAGRVTLRTRRVGKGVEIDVEDTGCGMTDQQMENIFFPFFTTKGVGKGTGLGLSISYGIVKSFGGGIEVVSEVGVGSRFTVVLPAADTGVRRRTGEQDSGGRDGGSEKRAEGAAKTG